MVAYNEKKLLNCIIIYSRNNTAQEQYVVRFLISPPLFSITQYEKATSDHRDRKAAFSTLRGDTRKRRPAVSRGAGSARLGVRPARRAVDPGGLAKVGDKHYDLKNAEIRRASGIYK